MEFGQQDSEGQDGIVIGTGPIIPRNGDFGSTFHKKLTFFNVVWRGSAARLAHGPMASWAFINPTDFTKTSQTKGFGGIVGTYNIKFKT